MWRYGVRCAGIWIVYYKRGVGMKKAKQLLKIATLTIGFIFSARAMVAAFNI